MWDPNYRNLSTAAEHPGEGDTDASYRIKIKLYSEAPRDGALKTKGGKRS